MTELDSPSASFTRLLLILPPIFEPNCPELSIVTFPLLLIVPAVVIPVFAPVFEAVTVNSFALSIVPVSESSPSALFSIFIFSAADTS